MNVDECGFPVPLSLWGEHPIDGKSEFALLRRHQAGAPSISSLMFVRGNNTARASHPRLVAATAAHELPRRRGRSAESLQPPLSLQTYSTPPWFAMIFPAPSTHFRRPDCDVFGRPHFACDTVWDWTGEAVGGTDVSTACDRSFWRDMANREPAAGCHRPQAGHQPR